MRGSLTVVGFYRRAGRAFYVDEELRCWHLFDLDVNCGEKEPEEIVQYRSDVEAFRTFVIRHIKCDVPYWFEEKFESLEKLKRYMEFVYFAFRYDNKFTEKAFPEAFKLWRKRLPDTEKILTNLVTCKELHEDDALETIRGFVKRVYSKEIIAKIKNEACKNMQMGINPNHIYEPRKKNDEEPKAA